MDGPLVSQIKRDLGIVETRVSYDPWGSFNLLEETGNSGAYFSVGVYAVKVSRDWYSWTTVSLYPIIQKHLMDGQGNAKVMAYKFDDDGNQVYFSGLVSVSDSNPHPIQSLTISGDEYVVYVFRVFFYPYLYLEIFKQLGISFMGYNVLLHTLP